MVVFAFKPLFVAKIVNLNFSSNISNTYTSKWRGVSYWFYKIWLLLSQMNIIIRSLKLFICDARFVVTCFACSRLECFFWSFIQLVPSSKGKQISHFSVLTGFQITEDLFHCNTIKRAFWTRARPQIPYLGFRLKCVFIVRAASVYLVQYLYKLVYVSGLAFSICNTLKKKWFIWF